tara:strand:+ start:1091 stop:2098 length:1008 start_codon:yes stop_codon:yes gene_type:complete
MTTEPRQGSIEQAASLIMEAPITETNPDEVIEETTEATDVNDQTEVQEPIAESEDATEETELELSEDDLDIEDEQIPAETAVPLELSDELEIEYKSDGEMRKKTLGELKRSAAGQDYIQRGMEENARLRKELDAQLSSQAEKSAKLDAILAEVESGNIPQQPVKPSLELATSDPMAYAIELGEYNTKLAEYEAKKVELEQSRSLALEKQKADRDAYAREQGAILLQELPELKDPEKSKALLGEIADTAINHYGVPPEVLKNLVHTWEFKLMKDAVAYRKLIQKKQGVVAKTKNARPMVKPGAKKVEDGAKKKAERARQNMRKTGSQKDVVNFLLS